MRFSTLALRTLACIILVLCLLPLLAVVWVSFFADQIIRVPPSGYTLGWYSEMWKNQTFRDGFITSVIVGVWAVIGGLAIGVPASFAIARATFPGRELVRFVLLSPLFIPAIVAGAGLFILFIRVEMATGIQLAGAPLGLSLAHVAIALPWSVRIVTASLLKIDPSLEEAARGLGAGTWTTLRRVTLPLIKPALVASALFSFLASFVDLEKTIFLVGPGQVTLPIAIMNYVEWSLDPTIAAAAVAQIAIVAVALILLDRKFSLGRTF